MWEGEKTRESARNASPPWNTKGTWEYYEWRRALVSRFEPNAAHLTLVEIGSYFDYFWLITQNVDGLHTRAGSKQVLELHGNMRGGRCPRDGAIVDLPQTPLESLPPYHSCGAALRPHVVQFGKSLDHATLNAAITTVLTASARAELFLVIGTSAVVSLARELPIIALKKGATVIELNQEQLGVCGLNLITM